MCRFVEFILAMYTSFKTWYTVMIAATTTEAANERFAVPRARKSTRKKLHNIKINFYEANKENINAKRREKYKANSQIKKNTNVTHILNLKKSINKFHSSLEMKIIQCCICHEAWPLSCSTKSAKNPEYICLHCKKDKKVSIKFSK